MRRARSCLRPACCSCRPSWLLSLGVLGVDVPGVPGAVVGVPDEPGGLLLGEVPGAPLVLLVDAATTNWSWRTLLVLPARSVAQTENV